MRWPVALWIAFATAAPTPVMLISPMPRAHRRVRVGDVGPDDLDRGHLEVHRNVVPGEARIHDAALALVDLRFLHEGKAEAHDDAAPKLAPRGLGVEDAAAVERAEETADARARAAPPRPGT